VIHYFVIPPLRIGPLALQPFGILSPAGIVLASNPWAVAGGIASAVLAGWAVARLGCFTVHDHPGILTTLPLAVAFPEGPRHDLGLDDALVLIGIAVIVRVLDRSRTLRGRLLALVAALYGMARFGLDFLRARDLPYVEGAP
jgi:phosphatidylglycerol:prolipoprotein diacylglycerol transferase